MDFFYPLTGCGQVLLPAFFAVVAWRGVSLWVSRGRIGICYSRSVHWSRVEHSDSVLALRGRLELVLLHLLVSLEVVIRACSKPNKGLSSRIASPST